MPPNRSPVPPFRCLVPCRSSVLRSAAVPSEPFRAAPGSDRKASATRVAYQAVIRWAFVAVCGCAAAGAQPLEPYELLNGPLIEFAVPPEAAQSMSQLERGNDRIDPAIRTLLMEADGLGQRALAERAEGLSVPLDASTERVAVALSARDDASEDELIAIAEDSGAEVTVTWDGVAYAWVPLDAVEELGRARALDYMSAQSKAEPDYPAAAAAGRIAVDGVAKIGAERMHRDGVTGIGVKVGILDFGFERYGELQREGRVPAPAAVKAFNRSGRWDAESRHGTACAEIVHAMAPDAELYLAAISGYDSQVLQAAQWLAAQGVQIVSYSGNSRGGPFDGRGPKEKLVDELSARGILWVNSAGNYAERHWSGIAEDRDGDGWIETWPNGQEFLEVVPHRGQYKLLVHWDDWGADPSRPAATLDINAYLFQIPSSGPPEPVARSVNTQRGRGKPQELLEGQVPDPSLPYTLALHAPRGTRRVRVHVHALNQTQLTPKIAASSIGSPATARTALAVGAVDVDSDALAPYSSHGPTDDGRIKPDVVAPTRTRSDAYNGTFTGTSAACPHVAGYAALLKQVFPTVDLYGWIAGLARPMVSPAGSANNSFGWGHVDAKRFYEEATREDRLDWGDRKDRLTYGEPTLDLPAAWGGRIEAARLMGVVAAARDGREVGLRVVAGRREYRIGDGLKVGVSTQRDCFYLLLGRDSRGQYTVISPLGEDEERLYADAKRVFPEEGSIRVTGPPGTDELVLIGARRQLDLNGRGAAESISVAKTSYRVVR